MKDRSTGWFGVVFGTIFIVVFLPDLLTYFSGGEPHVKLKTINFYGADAALMAFLFVLSGVFLVGLGFRHLLKGS